MEQYLCFKLQSECVKVEENIKHLAEGTEISHPYQVYYLIMKNVERIDNSNQSTNQLSISRKKLEIIKLLSASCIAIAMGLWLTSTNIGKNPKVFFIADEAVGDKKVTITDVVEPPRTVAEDSEENAGYQEIKDRFNIQIPQFGYLPEGMKYDTYHVYSGESLSAYIMYFDKDGYTFSYQIFGRQAEHTMGIFWDDKLIKEYQLKVKGQVIDIRQHEIVETKQTTMVAQFSNEDILCFIGGVMDPVEFEKVISNLIIFD